MEYIRFFFLLNFKSIKNSCLFDKERKRKTIINSILIILLMLLSVYLLNRFVFNGFLSDIDESIFLIASVSITLMFFIFFFIQFAEAINKVLVEIYRSPDLNYLNSMPLPVNYIFLYKFLTYIANGIKRNLLFVLPVFISLGIVSEAYWLYYLLILPVFFLFSLLPSLLGILFGMIGLNFLKIKIFNRVAQGLNFLANALIWIIIIFDSDLFISFTERIMVFFEYELLVDLFPITAAANTLVASMLADYSLLWRPFLFLILVTFLMACIIFYAAKGLFYQGWVANQGVELKKKKKKVHHKDNKKNKNPNYAMLTGEWKMAFRNTDILSSTIMLIILVVAGLLYFSFSNILVDSSLFAFLIFIILASIGIFIIIAIPFTSIEMATNFNLMKEKYWLYKIMPAKAKDMHFFQLLMYLIPCVVFMLPFSLIFGIARSLSIPIILLGFSYFILINIAHISLSNLFDMIYISKYLDKKKSIGMILSFLVPLLYHLLVILPLAFYLLPEGFLDIEFFAMMSRYFNLGISLFIPIVVVFLTYFLSKKYYLYYWDKLEI
ncbi:putative ABC transporter permease subunit [Natronospora cellulosivora (SeqCode)]